MSLRVLEPEHVFLQNIMISLIIYFIKWVAFFKLSSFSAYMFCNSCCPWSGSKFFLISAPPTMRGTAGCFSALGKGYKWRLKSSTPTMKALFQATERWALLWYSFRIFKNSSFFFSGIHATVQFCLKHKPW